MFVHCVCLSPAQSSSRASPASLRCCPKPVFMFLSSLSPVSEYCGAPSLCKYDCKMINDR